MLTGHPIITYTRRNVTENSDELANVRNANITGVLALLECTETVVIERIFFE